MKKQIIYLAVILIGLQFTGIAQKTYKIGKYKVSASGALVSTIKLVDTKKKELGKMFTHYKIGINKLDVTIISTDKAIPYLIINQSITKDDALDLIPDITVQKSVYDGLQNTLPSTYWNVSIAFKNGDGEYKDVGNTAYYKKDGTTTTKTDYNSTSYLIPFLTKKAADAFAAKAKYFFIN